MCPWIDILHRNFFLERFEQFLTLEIDFENQILALFDGYFWPFNKSHEKIKSIFEISAIITSIWNVFIEFRWRDEKLTQPILRQTNRKNLALKNELKHVSLQARQCAQMDLNPNWIGRAKNYYSMRTYLNTYQSLGKSKIMSTNMH